MTKPSEYTTIVENLLLRFPEFRNAYEQELQSWHPDKPPPHIVYVDLFGGRVDTIMQNLLTAEDSVEFSRMEQQIQQYFDHIEELASSSDFDILCLVETGLLEHFLGEPGGITRYARFMGTNTKYLARQVAQRWGLELDSLNS